MVGPRILLFGAVGRYTPALARVLAPHCTLLGCVVRRPVGAGLEQWFRHALIRQDLDGFPCPVWSTGAPEDQKLYDKLSKKRVDLIVVAGFPRRLPVHLLSGTARRGAVNVHPSRLPDDRGASPLFWLFRRGDASTAVTVHELTPELDQGAILASAAVEVPRGVEGSAFFAALGERGGRLVAERLPELLDPGRSGEPQGEPTHGWARRPAHEDWELVASEWTAERLFHFVRGARAFGRPWATLADERYYFNDALELAPGAKMPGEFAVLGERLVLQVQDGTVTLRLEPC